MIDCGAKFSKEVPIFHEGQSQYITILNSCSQFNVEYISLALRSVGLLPPGSYQLVPFAYIMYKRLDKHVWDQLKSAFRVDDRVYSRRLVCISAFSNKEENKKYIIRIVARGILFRLLVPIRGKSLPVTTASAVHVH